MEFIEIFDSTLRDGAQSEGVSYSITDKLNIVKALDAFGVSYIEAGNPGSNPKDIEFFKKAKALNLKNASLCAFGSTRRKNTAVEGDENVISLLNAETDAVAIFGKAYGLHVREVLGASEDENLEMIFDTVEFFKKKGKTVIFDAEHFYDGYKDNPEYAVKVLEAAGRGGADVLVLCDTNGGTMPDRISAVTSAVSSVFSDIKIGVHCHNDGGCAAANSVLAVKAGAKHVQGTFIGTGERCGNADLSIVIPNLMLKYGYNCLKEDTLGELTDIALKIYEISNLVPPSNKPYSGSSAFAHKGGMHIDGMDKYEKSFEHIDPKTVGNRRRYLISEMSGRSTVIAKISGIAPELKKNSPETKKILQRIKELEHDGYQFESADASFELRVLETLGRFKPSFNIKMYKTSGEYPSSSDAMTAYALVHLAVGSRTETAASVGNGPVNALDAALRKALCLFYPEVKNIRLTDYKVRVLSGSDATGAKVRVLIENTDGKNVWTTVGVSTDIIEASSIALVDATEYYLYVVCPAAKKGEGL